jgi:carboxyl-terminal processing protease
VTPTYTATSTALAPTATPSLTPTPLPPTPAPTETPTPTVQPTPSAAQLGVFEEIWKTVQDNYLYRDFNGLDWEKVHAEYQGKIEAGLTQEDFYAAMYEMIYRLGDDHSTYFSPEEAKAEDAQFNSGFDYVGIGILPTFVEKNRHYVVVQVFPGSPAEEAGIKPHDSILEVDGKPLVDDQGAHRALLRGPEGSQAVLTIQSPGEAPRPVSITRRRVISELPIPYQVINSPSGKRVGYIFLTSFDEENIPKRVKAALLDMNKGGPLDGLILDNRFNGGGISTVFENILSFFTAGTVGHFTTGQERRAINVGGQDIKGSQRLPLVVLVGKDTASFGEIFSGVLKDLNRATILGEKTDGNVEILGVFNFSDGSRIWLAHETFRPRNHPDQNWEETGIIPDQAVTGNWDEFSFENDPVVLASLQHFDELKK